MTTLEFHRVSFVFFHGVYVCACRTSSDCAPLSPSPPLPKRFSISSSLLSRSRIASYRISSSRALAFSVIVGASLLHRTAGLLFVSYQFDWLFFIINLLLNHSALCVCACARTFLFLFLAFCSVQTYNSFSEAEGFVFLEEEEEEEEEEVGGVQKFSISSSPLSRSRIAYQVAERLHLL